MNPVLITYHDRNQKLVAKASSNSHSHFSKTYDLDWVSQECDDVDPDCYMRKVEMTFKELMDGRPFVVWTDNDVVFNKELDKTFLQSFSTKKPVMMLGNNNEKQPVFVTGFFIAQNTPEVKGLFTTWMTHGYIKDARRTTDQEIFESLYRKYKWVRDMVGTIPDTYITSPCGPLKASIGKHFFGATDDPHDNMRAQMEYYAKTQAVN